MQAENIIFVIVLIFSIIMHELAHGYAADAMGDPTPRLDGRLTMNPIVHMDLFGSVLLPLFLVISGAPFVFGWAKPVRFNPHHLRNRRWGGALVALAGPLSNILLALVAALLVQTISFSPFIASFLVSIVITNVALAIFNLVPIPPLDGHHVLFAALPDSMRSLKANISKYSIPLVLLLVFFGFKYLSPIIMGLSQFFLSFI